MRKWHNRTPCYLLVRLGGKGGGPGNCTGGGPGNCIVGGPGLGGGALLTVFGGRGGGFLPSDEMEEDKRGWMECEASVGDVDTDKGGGLFFCCLTGEK